MSRRSILSRTRHQFHSPPAIDACWNTDADGFFAVYTTVFSELHQQEKSARGGDVHRPGLGSAGAAEEAVTAFYVYWLAFSTSRSDRAFAKHDKWDLSDAPSRVMRRLMQQKNLAVREKARKMFNDKVCPSHHIPPHLATSHPRCHAVPSCSMLSHPVIPRPRPISPRA